jgi:NADH-quinone oxidoreductase subunit F
MEEGIKFEFLANPSKILKSDGNLRMTITRMKLGDDIDASGRRPPVVMEGADFEQDFDTIIPAIGQVTDIPQTIAVAKNKNGTIIANPDTMATNLEGVWAGGDVVTGPDSVIRAIAAGRLAAVEIDKYLGGKGVIEEKFTTPEKAQPYQAEEGGVEKRQDIPVAAAGKRVKNFDRAELGYTKELAEIEATRCLRCDLEERDED